MREREREREHAGCGLDAEEISLQTGAGTSVAQS